MGAAPTHAERTGTSRDRNGRADAVGVDGGTGLVGGLMDAEVFAARTLGFEALGNGADETGIGRLGRSERTARR